MKKNKSTIHRKITRRLSAAALSLGFLLTGCGSGETGTTAVVPDQPKPAAEAAITNLTATVQTAEVPKSEVSAVHADAMAKSGVMILQKLMEQGGEGNYLISPTSIQMALGMTALGTSGDTKKELMSVLIPGVEDPDKLHEEMATVTAKMKAESGVSWNVANSIWVNSNKTNHKMKESYLSGVKNNYQAEMYSAPFNEETKEAINNWVKENTRERIPRILENLPESTGRMVLVNAMAFDAEWFSQYEESDVREEWEFTNADGSKSQVTMLMSEESRAINLAGGLGFIRPYKGGEYTFVGILPPEGMTTEAYLKKIMESPDSFAKAYREADGSRDVYVTMPEFKVEYGNALDDTLRALGVKSAYGDGADFSAMLEEGSDPMQISTVIHKTMIEVDRKGTKAAAATVVVQTDGAVAIEEDPPYVVTLDRPFIYAIVDNATGMPIFLGAQNQME